MKWPLLLLSISAIASGNADELSADRVIVLFYAEMDLNKDGVLTVNEVFNEMLSKFDPDKDSLISKNEFVTQWHAKFRDVPDFAEYLFLHFDQDCDNMISVTDAPSLITIMDLDSDQQVTETEYAEYMSYDI